MGLLYFNKFITQSFRINHNLTPLYLQKVKNIKEINMIKLMFFLNSTSSNLHKSHHPPSNNKNSDPNPRSSTSLISVKMGRTRRDKQRGRATRGEKVEPLEEGGEERERITQWFLLQQCENRELGNEKMPMV